jgi:hypothetical protein
MSNLRLLISIGRSIYFCNTNVLKLLDFYCYGGLVLSLMVCRIKDLTSDGELTTWMPLPLFSPVGFSIQIFEPLKWHTGITIG